MSMSLKIRSKSGLLRVVATGQISLEEAKRTFLEILDAVVRHKAKHILFDGRTLTGDPSTLDRFFFGEFAAQMVRQLVIDYALPPAPQFAYVLHIPVLDPQRFGETVAVNRGLWFKAFDDIDEALRWLG